MPWVLLTLASAFFLGLYDLAKKNAVRRNPPVAVLFWSVVTGAVSWAPFVIAVHCGGGAALPAGLRVDPSLTLAEHGLLLVKSAIVGASWAFAYVSVAQLPISIAAPIRSTSPVWTILIAVTCMGERPTAGQWLGVLVILAAFYAFAVAGALEGVHFTRNKWVGCMALSTFIAACSSLYDKYLLQSTRLDVPTVQAWFSIYLVPVVAPLYLWWKSRTRGSDVRFRWEWGVPAIAWLLLAADYLYFSALRADGALIAVISPLRRTAVVVSLTGGILLFGEHGFRRKALCVAGMLVGVVLLSW